MTTTTVRNSPGLAGSARTTEPGSELRAEAQPATENVLVYDTTLRDGTQGEGVSLSLQDKLNIAARLAEFGIDMIEGGYPLSNEKDTQFFQKVKQLKLGDSLVAAFGMTRRRGVSPADDPGMKALVGAATPVITIVGKTWDFQVTDILSVSLEENLDMIGDSIRFCRRNADVVYDAEHFFDGYKANRQYAIQTIRAAASAGAKWIVLCDTNGGTLPEEIAQIVRDARESTADSGVGLGIHCHNDGDLATANSLAAVDAGCRHIQGTVNGIGERCGNADLVAVLANLAFKKTAYHLNCRGSLAYLTELSRYVYETANLQLRMGQPFVGQSAFAHKGGMHVHAINKAASTYEHMDPALVGNTRRILISELSGRSNIVATAGRSVADDPQLQQKILAEVVRRENAGYQYEAAEASFELLVQRSAGTFRPHFEAVKYRVDAGDASVAVEDSSYAESILQVRVGDEMRIEAAMGNGPIDALDAALRKALTPFFPALSEMKLLDYKVRVVNSDAGTAAKIRVNIESADDAASWRTIGVSENIIEASWLALVDAIEYKLHRESGRL